MKSVKLSAQCNTDLVAYLKNPIASPEHFVDRMRILSIIALCFDTDDTLLKQAIACVKESQSQPGAPAYFEASSEKYLQALWNRAAKIKKERSAVDSKQRSFFGAFF